MELFCTISDINSVSECQLLFNFKTLNSLHNEKTILSVDSTV